MAVIRLLLAHGADPTSPPAGKNAKPPLVAVCAALEGTTAQVVVPLVEALLEHGAGGVRGEVAGRALLAAGEGGGDGGGRERDGCGGGGGVLLDVMRLLVGERGGARPTHEVIRALWWNGSVGVWEKRAVQAVLDGVAEAGLKRDEAEWLIVAF